MSTSHILKSPATGSIHISKKISIYVYGIDTIGSNLHNLSHVFKDVQRFGCLMDVSTYPFENRLQFLKLRVKQRYLPLQQITRRLVELSLDYDQLNTTSSCKSSTFPQLRFPFKLDGKFVYKELQIDSGCTISAVRKSDCWFLTRCNQIVSMKYAFADKNDIVVYGTPIKNREIFFSHPISSRFLDIYKSDGETCPVFSFKLQSVKSKMICLSDELEFVFMPLLHTLKSI